MTKVILIAAAAENNALGLNGDLPWHLPDDFKHFKRLTSGHKIIMGRKTLETFPRPLPNREHLVISRDLNYRPKFEATVFNSLEKALDYCSAEEKIYIIGGGEIYHLALPFATHIELTRVHTNVEADAFFPKLDPNEWLLVNEEMHCKDDRHAYDFTFQQLERKTD